MYPSMGMGTHGSTYPSMHQGMHGGMYGGMMPSSLGISRLDPYSSLRLGSMGGLGSLGGLGSIGGLGIGRMMMGMPRSRRNPYYNTYAYRGGGLGGHGYGGGSPYELCDESMYEDNTYMDDYDDIEDLLLAYLRMQQRGGGRRGRRYYDGMY